MAWLLRHNWMWSLLAFLAGAAITWILLDRRQPVAAPEPAEAGHPAVEKVEEWSDERSAEKAGVLVGAEPSFSRLMESDPHVELTLFDTEPDTHATQPQVRADVPPGRYGEGSADAVPHQGPPDGFTIKGNALSMLFHTPDSPYYGRTKPEVWFRTEADAERAGFTKYARRPRKSANPGDH